MAAIAEKSRDDSAVIGAGISITGTVTADANLKIEGFVQGQTIHNSHDVEVGSSGKVIANIQARLVKIGGQVAGDVIGIEKVLITRTGRVQGNIRAPRVQLEDGAIFKGTIDMDPVEQSRARKPEPADKTTAKPATATSTRPKAGPGGEPKSTGSDSARKEPSLTLKSG